MPIAYDPIVIKEFAQRLYKKANSIIASYVLLGAILLGLGGLLTLHSIFGIIGALIGCAIGYIMGREKAFSYKLQAQTALCQVQIEANSRVQNKI